MTEEVMIQIDDVQEFIIQKVTDDEQDVEAFAQQLFDDSVYQIYTQYQQAEQGGAAVQPDE